MKYKRVIILLADGARPDILEELLSKGELPSINKHLLDSGSYLNAVTAFPSTTGPAYLPFLTGCLPATCNVPGIRWMDKVRYAMNPGHHGRHRSYVGLETYLMGRDIRKDIPTLFELLKNSYNIFNSVNRGVKISRNLTRISRIWYWYYAHLTDRWNFVDTTAIKKFRKVLSKEFEMIFLVMPGIDEYSHIAHFKNSECIDAYKKVDEAVASAHRILSKDGRWNDTLFWIVSDHGLSATHSHFCINTFLEERGLRALYYPKIFKKNCDVANMMSGNGMTHLYFKHDDGWQFPVHKKHLDKKYPNLMTDLIKEKAVDILACRIDEKRIHIASRKGSATAEMKGDGVIYNVITGDPFGYRDINGFIGPEDSLDKTFNTNYPDAIYQIAHIFMSHRSGDVVISASPGYDLRDEHEVPEHKGSHGSLHSEHMHVPALTNAKLKSKLTRTIDIFPTTLELLGHPIPSLVDGKVISNL